MSKRWLFRMAAAASMALCMAAPAWADTTVTLAWDANAESDLAGYRLYHGNSAGGPYTAVQTLAAVTTTSVIVGDGRHYWVLTAFDAAGNESGYSNEVTFLADSAPPAAPSALRIQSAVVVR